MPDNKEERAKKADLVTFPKGIPGANCANCMYVDPDNSYCLHPDVDQPLTDGIKRMCCSLWDQIGTNRKLQKK